MPDNNNATPADAGATSGTNAPVAGAGDGQAVNPAAAVAPTVPEAAATNDPVVPVDPNIAAQAAAEAPQVDNTNIQAEIVRRIGESGNVLVALSSDPSVDEMAAAIGLSLYLDKLGKRATAIYSGSTPNALEFLKPEETFEPSVDALQDFVIALNKEKADHLRYKLDGDYVKIYITPYRTRIGEEDLDFSYGDFNVDLVLALDVANGADLDAALREHGRIMHDASIVNITTGKPGKLGEIEWSDKSASSVSEMIARLLYSINGKAQIEKEEATAFLTGIVAATNRFSNANTTPATMKLASKLMDSGANQQLIAKNITPDIENEMYSMKTMEMPSAGVDDDPTKLDISHGSEENADENKVINTNIAEKDSTLLDDLKAAEASLATAGAETVSVDADEPLKIDSSEAGNVEDVQIEETPSGTAEVAEPTVEPVVEPAEKTEPATNEPASAPATETNTEPAASEPAAGGSSEEEKAAGSSDEMSPQLPKVETEEEKSADPLAETSGLANPEKVIQPSEPSEGEGLSAPEKVIQPPSDFVGGLSNDAETEKYGHMLEDAISSLNAAAASMPAVTSPVVNPAASSAPTVASNPEINGVPEINYMPMPGDSVLPPPPAPPIDMNNVNAPASTATPIQPAAPVTSQAEPLGAQPSMQDQVYTPQASDPGAFKIPGM